MVGLGLSLSLNLTSNLAHMLPSKPDSCFMFCWISGILKCFLHPALNTTKHVMNKSKQNINSFEMFPKYDIVCLKWDISSIYSIIITINNQNASN